MTRILTVHHDELSDDSQAVGGVPSIGQGIPEEHYDYVFIAKGEKLQCVKAREGRVGEYDPEALHRLLMGAPL